MATSSRAGATKKRPASKKRAPSKNSVASKRPSTGGSGKTKVAVLGGGIAGVVAAYQLTATPALRSRYDVTIYQMGWRLGGKCASGRNADLGDRIEEHGLHIWFGFYDNSIDLMRRCYEELAPDAGAPFHSFEEAFMPCDEIVLGERYNDRWVTHRFDVPRNGLEPGSVGALPTIWELAERGLVWAADEWERLAGADPGRRGSTRAHLPPLLQRIANMVDEGLITVSAKFHDQLLAAATSLARSLQRLERQSLDGRHHLLCRLLRELRNFVWDHVSHGRMDDDELRNFAMMLDLFSTILIGLVDDDVLERGFDAINDEELRAWLARHGAHPYTTAHSPVLRGWYSGGFAFKDGDPAQPNVAAGTAIHAALRIFTYKGSVLQKMRSGMGDTVLTPFYRVLQQRGVTIKFFHRVSDIRLDDTGAAVGHIDVVEQVEVPDGEYRPLDGESCWPNQPDWSQLTDGSTLHADGINFEYGQDAPSATTHHLERGTDFDDVVLAIPVGALASICGDLMRDTRRTAFADMVDNSNTVMTQAFQLWTNERAADLGWAYDENSILTAYDEPIDTYADMAHLIGQERWPRGADVASIAYFCGVLPDLDGDTQEAATARAYENGRRYVERDLGPIWKHSGRPFDWPTLVDPDDGDGPARFDAQYWRANFQPTERYTLSLTGTMKYRLASDESGYDNLWLAGDWIRNGIDAGCVEATVMSGMQAARAISGERTPIVGEDHTWLEGRTRTAHRSTAPTAPSRSAPARSAPRYVEYGAVTTAPPPFRCANARMWAFFLEADHTRLQAMCDAVFATPSSGAVRYHPLGRHVMMTLGTMDVTSMVKPYDQMGTVTELHAAFWVITVAVEQHGPVLVAERLASFIPTIFVDNPISLAGGREVYGFNKAWGWPTLPDHDELDAFHLDVFGGDFGDHTFAGRHRLIDLTRADDGPIVRTPIGDLGDTVDHLVGEILPAEGELLVPGLHLAESLYEQLRRRSMTTAFLKQFRSVLGGHRASQQQIIEAPTDFDRIEVHRLEHHYDFTMLPLDSHPFARELGITPSQRVGTVLEIDSDFVQDVGTVLWESTE